jgi:glucan phosphoethanolaminetransferase (alkaline phosphatase superfamily)
MKLKNNFTLSFIITLMLFVPDILANYKWVHYSDYNLETFVFGIVLSWVVVFLLTMMKDIYFVFISFSLVALGFIELVYYDFFYSYMNNYDWGLITESEDIIGSLKSIAHYLFIVLVVMTLFLLALYFLKKYLKPRRSKYAKYLFLTILISLVFYISNNNNFPNKKYFSYINTGATLISALIHYATPEQKQTFKPYEVSKNTHVKPIVIMIMGESLNAKKMHLFDFPYKDTPLLDKLKKDEHFQYKMAISAGVNTAISVPTFFYIKREPHNRELEASDKTNLMYLAKKNGYKTYWLSTQHEEKETALIYKYADVVKTRDDWKSPLYDDVLLNFLKDINFSKKTFVVLHLRADHSPYEEYTPKKYYKWKYQYDNYYKYKLFSYANSVLYVDNLIYSIIEYMKSKKKHFVLYFTSDHGEMLGEKSEGYKYGHSQLDMNCAHVPFLYYSDKYSKKLDLKMYNHYIIGKMLADDLGYTIKNPNEDGSYSLNGVGEYGQWGEIKYKFPLK